MGFPYYEPRQKDDDTRRTLLDFNGDGFTLDGVAVEVKVRPKGMRVGCHFATHAAIKKLAELDKISDPTPKRRRRWSAWIYERL